MPQRRCFHHITHRHQDFTTCSIYAVISTDILFFITTISASIYIYQISLPPRRSNTLTIICIYLHLPPPFATASMDLGHTESDSTILQTRLCESVPTVNSSLETSMYYNIPSRSIPAVFIYIPISCISSVSCIYISHIAHLLASRTCILILPTASDIFSNTIRLMLEPHQPQR